MNSFILHNLLFSAVGHARPYIKQQRHKKLSIITSTLVLSISSRLASANAGLTDPQQIKQQLLSQLVDVQTPAPIGLWPFAPGVWAMIFICLASISCWVVFRYYKRQNRYRAIALQIHDDLRITYNKSAKDVAALQQYIHDGLTLLKQVTFTAYPKQRADIAGYSSNQFIELLLNNLPNGDKHFAIDKIRIPEQLLYGKPENIDFSVVMFERFIQTWINQHNRNKHMITTKNPHTMEASHVSI